MAFLNGEGSRPRKGKSKTNRPGPAIESVRRKRQQSAQILTFPVKPLSPHGIQFIFKEYNFAAFVASKDGRYGTTSPLAKYQKTNENDKKVDLKSTLTIELPFPTSLTDATGLTISGIERDLVTAAIGDSLSKAFAESPEQGAGLVKSLATQLQGLGSELANSYQTGSTAVKNGEAGGFAGGASAVASNIYDKLKSTLNISMEGAKLLGSYLARDFLGDISKTIAMDSGLAINPQETLSFEGVELKTYTFDWQLYPSNKADSDRIKELVRKIKSRILPKMSGSDFEASLGNLLNSTEGIKVENSAVGRLFLSYPDTVIMNLVGVDESHWPLFKPAMCTGIDVDYAGGGDMVIAEGGRPAAVTLSMSFSELVIHTQDDYEDTPTISPPDVENKGPKFGGFR